MLNLSDAFGTARFGQQSLQQGRDITSALSAGFIRRMNMQEEERKQKEAESRALIGGIAALAGAAVGSQIEGLDPTLGATIGMEAGKALIGRAEPENIINVALKQEELGQTAQLAREKMKASSRQAALKELDAMSKSDLVKQGLQEVSADTPGGGR